MRYESKKSIDKFNKLFGFKVDPFSQDWGLEQCDSSRLTEFLTAYSTQCSNDDDRFTLMMLILASYEDLVDSSCHSDKIWCQIKALLLSHKELHKNTIDYWALWDEPEQEDHDNWFVLTKLIREVAIAEPFVED